MKISIAGEDGRVIWDLDLGPGLNKHTRQQHVAEEISIQVMPQYELHFMQDGGWYKGDDGLLTSPLSLFHEGVEDLKTPDFIYTVKITEE